MAGRFGPGVALLLAMAFGLATLIPAAASAQAWRASEQSWQRPQQPYAQAEVPLSGGGRMIAVCAAGEFSMNWRPGFRYEVRVLQSIRISWPGQAPEVQNWLYDPVLEAFESAASVVFARRIGAGRAPVLEMPDGRGRMRAVTVPVTGAAAEIGRVMETCGRNPTDFETARPDIDPRVVAYVDGLSAIDGYLLRHRLLGEQRIESASPRPTELYEAVNLVWRERFPALCRDQANAVSSTPVCTALRDAQAVDAAAPVPARVNAVIDLYLRHCCEAQALEARRRQAESAASNSCGQPDTNPVPLNSFRMERAYPAAAIERGQQGVLVAAVQVSATGQVTAVDIRAAHPVGIFETAAERELRALYFTPAKRNCEPVAGVFVATVVFALAN